MTPKQLYDKTNEIIDSALSKYQKRVNAAQTAMWSKVFRVINTLEVDEAGNILSTGDNLMKIRKLRGELKRAIRTKAYRKGTNLFLNSFSAVKSSNDGFFKEVAPTLNPNKNVFKEVLKGAIEPTKNSLLNSGLDENIIKPVQEILNQNITSGGSLNDMANTIRMEILGNDERLGRLARYSKQITTDSIQQFNANYNTAISKDLNIEFYVYQGPVSETSRAYCKDRVNNGRWFHIKEIEQSASMSWAGKIPGTDRDWET